MSLRSTFLSITAISLTGIGCGMSFINPPLAHASGMDKNHQTTIGIDVEVPILEKNWVQFHFKREI